MARGVNRLMGPGGQTGSGGMKTAAIGNLDAIQIGPIAGPVAPLEHRHGPGSQGRRCRCQPLRFTTALDLCLGPAAGDALGQATAGLGIPHQIRGIEHHHRSEADPLAGGSGRRSALAICGRHLRFGSRGSVR